MNIEIHAVLDAENGMGNDDHLLYTAPSVIIRYLKELAQGKIVVVGSKVPAEVYNELRKECDDVVIFTHNRNFVGPNGTKVIHKIRDVMGYAIIKDVLIVCDVEACEAFEPLATKMHLTVIDATFPSTLFFPDYDPSAWEETQGKVLEGSEVTGWKKLLFKNYSRLAPTA